MSTNEMTKDQPSTRKGTLFRFNIRTYTMVIALAALWLLFGIVTQGLFINPRNLSNLFEQSAETAILAVGMTLVIVAAEIDLSVGSLTGLAGGIAAMCQVWLHWNTTFSIVAALAVGVFLGLMQGWWVAYQKVPSFIVTLGGMLIFRGVLIGLTNGTSVAPLSMSFMNIGQAYLPIDLGTILAILVIVSYIGFIFWRRRTRAKFGFETRSILWDTLSAIGATILIGGFIYLLNMYAGVPEPLVILLMFAAVFSFVANKTKFGRQIYAIGGNREASRMSGIPVKRRVLLVFALSGLLAGVTGLVLTARLGAGTVDAGTNYELNAIAACVIGGSSLMGGIGTIFGSIIGALVIGSIDNGMSLLDAAPFWEYVVKGGILILAVWVDMAFKNRRS